MIVTSINQILSIRGNHFQWELSKYVKFSFSYVTLISNIKRAYNLRHLGRKLHRHQPKIPPLKFYSAKYLSPLITIINSEQRTCDNRLRSYNKSCINPYSIIEENTTLHIYVVLMLRFIFDFADDKIKNLYYLPI